jgi:hydroxymethylbilane synthase
VSVIRLGTRGSALALYQTRWVAARMRLVDPEAQVEIVEISSAGDQITDVPLSMMEGTGFFTSSIERALIAGEVDVAVHSYKDLPVDAAEGLVVAAVPERAPVEDVLCAQGGLAFHQLPHGASIGTCSARRTAQVRAIRPDLDIRPLRGNVPTRVGRVTSGELDAIVLARAGLMRLGLDRHVTEVFPIEMMLPAPAQGALAVQCRAADTDLRQWLSALDHLPTRRAVQSERTLLHALGGGCAVPVGAVATCDGPALLLTAGVFALDTPRAVRVVERGTDPDVLAATAAKRLLLQGADGILEEFQRQARIEWPQQPGVAT